MPEEEKKGGGDPVDANARRRNVWKDRLLGESDLQGVNFRPDREDVREGGSRKTTATMRGFSRGGWEKPLGGSRWITLNKDTKKEDGGKGERKLTSHRIPS